MPSIFLRQAVTPSKRILVLDDMKSRVEALFRHVGHFAEIVHCLTVSDLKATLESQRTPFDLILLDHDLGVDAEPFTAGLYISSVDESRGADGLCGLDAARNLDKWLRPDTQAAQMVIVWSINTKPALEMVKSLKDCGFAHVVHAPFSESFVKNLAAALWGD